MLSTSKMIGGIDREVRSLVASVDAGATRLVALHPDAGLTVHRGPERFLLQAGDVGVTISFFRSRAGAEVGAELVLGVWKGDVTFPGRTPQAGHRATQLSTQQFRIATSDDTSWVWLDETTTDTMTSNDLAIACVETMAKRLPALDTAAIAVSPEAGATRG